MGEEHGVEGRQQDDILRDINLFYLCGLSTLPVRREPDKSVVAGMTADLEQRDQLD